MEKNLSTGSGTIRGALLAGLMGLGLFLLLTFLYALCCSRLLLPPGRETAACRGILAFAAICGAVLACGRRNRDKALCAAISGGVLMLGVILIALLALSAAAFHPALLVNLLCVILGSITGCILTLGRGKRRRRRRSG